MVVFRRRLINNRTPAFIGLVCLCSLFLLTRYGTFVTQRLSEESTETGSYRVTPAKDNFQITENVVKRGRKGVKSVKWTYRCDESRKACIRGEASEREEQVALDVCYLTCGTYGSVWPYPKTHLRGEQTVKFYPENLHLVDVQAKTEGVRRIIQKAFEIKHEYLRNSPGLNPKRIKNKSFFWSLFNFFGSKKANDVSTTEVHVSIFTLESDDILTLSTDESYEIKIQEDESEGNTIIEVIIIGDTFFGVRHGIETLSQLIAFDDINLCLQIIKDYTANDEPHYPYRGILIDTARNFLPLHLVKRVVDGMALNKLNVLHMHLTDSNTFPFYSERVPQLTEYGTLSPDQIYYPHQLKDLVQYAKIRGVKIIPELDAPSHAGNGWQFGRRNGLGDLAFQINLYNSSWPVVCGQPPCGFLNIANPNTYLLLEDLYADMLDIFDKDLFHMGGDEVNLDSWKVIPDLKEWHNVTSMMDLWKYFQMEAHKRLKKRSTNVTAILWTSHLTSEKDILRVLKPKDYIIQLWDTSKDTIESFLRKRYRVILSTADKFYLDHGAGTWLGKNHNWVYKNWQVLYDANKINFKHSEDTDDHGRKLFIGAEATLWGEKVGPDDVETKLWPRSSALAESFWSNPEKRDQETYTRINYHSRRFRQYKIPTSQMQPESCLHFYGSCENSDDML